ncbi:hypothetical protein [Mycolicibacterium sp.]|uniref:hypothetical protein n=1 Tax=Mycolicibacterium sp. TaxID=2320850 RepID=UPI00355D3D61
MTGKDDTAAEERTARGRIAVAAGEHGWNEMFGDVAENVRIYTRGAATVLVGYRPNGGVTGASRGRVDASGRLEKGGWLDQLTHLDASKAEQVLVWLAERD